MPPIIQDTPPALVEQGRFHCGFFKRPFRRLNPLDARGLCGSLPRPFSFLRLKEWVGFGICHPRLYGALIIQNAKFAASGAAYLYDRIKGSLHEWQIVELPWRVKLPETLWAGESRCGRGRKTMLFSHDLEHHRHRVFVDIQDGKGAPRLQADLTFHQDLSRTDSLVVSLPIEPHHHTYTHKSPLHLEGTLAIGDETYSFDPARDLANLDEHRTFFPYRSRWLWGSFATHTRQGHEVMINFIDPMTPKGQPGEDALWVDGKLTLIEPPVFIELPEPGAFLVKDSGGNIRLRFTPSGSKAEKINYGLISMDYEQYFGAYEGEIVDKNGFVHRIEEAFGALERMAARF